MDSDKIVFGKKKYGDLLKEIYEKQNKKNEQINMLISELKPLVQELGDATLIVPLIKGYVEAGIKNDDILLRLVSLIQKGEEKLQKDEDDSKKSLNDVSIDELGLTEEEKNSLLKSLYNDKKDN